MNNSTLKILGEQIQPYYLGPLDLLSNNDSLICFKNRDYKIGYKIYVEVNRNENLLVAYIHSIENNICKALVINKNFSSNNNRYFATPCLIDLPFTENLLGCAIDPLGKILKRVAKSDGTCSNIMKLSFSQSSPSPFSKKSINEIFYTGITPIDIFNTTGKGQRIAILAEPGIGKTSLITKLASNSSAEINIIALVGERAREINEFLEQLSEETLKKTILVTSTSDDPAALRLLSVQAAISLAEYFREKGKNVLLEIDSLTRYLRAFREVSLELGELPVNNGYSATVYPNIAKIMERIGNSSKGSITSFFTLLSSAELIEEPLVKEIISLTDGHLTLSKEIAKENIYPAIDLKNSLSRLQDKLLERDLLLRIKEIRIRFIDYLKKKNLNSLGLNNLENNTSSYEVIRDKLSTCFKTSCSNNSDLIENLDRLNSIFVV